MPIYEYRCEGCGEVFEVRQKFADEPLTQHDKCGGRVHRVLSAPALQFKGSGWYITDYARGGSSTSATKTESQTESKTDTNGSKSASTESKSTGTESSTKSSKSSKE